MEILADRDIAAVGDAFSRFGTLRLYEGRALTRADLGQASVLLVRSVSRVDANLLDGSAVRFVGTSTAGTDHVDTDYLNRRGIRFAAAPGCNARAVAEHVVTCIHAYAAERGRDVRDLRVAIIGFGHVGRALGALLGVHGIEFVVNDPPIAADLTRQSTVSLDDALTADVVTLHVPLTQSGPHATRGLLDAGRLRALAPGTLVINAARGGVLDEAALAACCAAGVYAAIDCWENEPAIDSGLLRAVWRATPHIAGHTLEARLEASRQLHDALNAYLEQSLVFPPRARERPLPVDAAEGIAAALEAVHPLALQTRRLRRLLALPAARRGRHFDDVRARYGLRREFAHYAVAGDNADPDTVERLRGLGFSAAP